MLTTGMEGYLKRICLLSESSGYTRVSDLADALSVNVASASKMARKLGESGYVIYRKYDRLTLTEKGLRAGKALIRRQQLIIRFLQLIGVPNDLIETEAERVEHHFSWITIVQIEKHVCFLEEQQSLKAKFVNTETL